VAPALLETSHGWFRTWFRKVWKIRGGGLYALGFIVFSSCIKKPIEEWMFDGEPGSDDHSAGA